ncbi:MAG: hypothetical protein U0893_12970 [Chloroflexota bacterium]
MVVVEQEATRDEPQPAGKTRKPGAVWSSAAQLRRSLPMVRLLARLAAIPDVKIIGALVDGDETFVHALTAGDERAAMSAIFEAEREYRAATKEHHFELRVTPLPRVPEPILREILSELEIVLER